MAQSPREAACQQLIDRGLPDKIIGHAELVAPGPNDTKCTVKSPTGQPIKDKAELDTIRQAQFQECVTDTKVSLDTINMMVSFFSACEI